MDISAHARAVAAHIYLRMQATQRDAEAIAEVFRRHPVENIDQHLALGARCPYWPNQRRERAAWLNEISIQREQLKTPNP